MSAIIAHGPIAMGQRVAFSSSQRSNAPRMMCSARSMSVSCLQIPGNSNKSNFTKNVANKGCIASSAKSRASLTTCSALVNVEFLVPELPLEFGQSLKIVGGAPALGNWEATSSSATLQWQEGNNWKGTAEVEAGSEVEFKLVKVAGEDWSSWEDGDNKVLSIPAAATAVQVVCNWGGDISVKISEKAAVSSTEEKEAPKKTKATSTKAKAPKKAAAKEEPKAGEPVEPVAAPPAAAVVDKVAAPQEIANESSPAPSHSDNGSNGVDLPSEMTSLASKISVGTDGALIIEFSGNADGVTAADLAAKLKN